MEFFKKIGYYFNIYFICIKEGKSLKDKLILSLYPFNFFINKIKKKKNRKLIGAVTIKNSDGVFFCEKDMGIVGVVNSSFEKKIKKYLKLKKGVFIDVGAHVGKYTISLGRKLKNKGKIISFEPSPKVFKILKKNIKLNRLNNVIPFQIALGEKEKKSNFYIDENEGKDGLSSLIKKTKKRVIVQVRKLDNVLKELKIRKVDLIKIDVEGAEAEVLKGAVKTLKKSHPKIIFEVWNEEYLKKCKRILKKFNYKIKKIDKENYLAY